MNNWKKELTELLEVDMLDPDNGWLEVDVSANTATGFSLS